MYQTEQLQELEENAYKEKNNKLRYLGFQEVAGKYLAKKDVTEEDLEHVYQLYKLALNAAQKTHNTKLECQALIDLGSISVKMDKTDDAIKFYEEALEIALLRKDSEAGKVQIRIYTKLGWIHANLGNYNLANYCFEQAKEIANIARQTQEQTSPKLLAEPQNGTRPKLSPTTRTHIKASSQVKQVGQVGEATRRLTITVGIILFITLVIFSINVLFGSHSLSPSDVFVISLIIITIIILPFLKRIFGFIYHEETQD